MLEQVAQWDVRVSLALQARRNRFVNFLAAALSWSGAGGVWFSVGGGLWFAQWRGIELVPRQATFLACMFGAFVVLLVGGVIKRLAKRPRPFTSSHGISAAIWAPGRARSFPSTHAATSVALAVSLLVVGHPYAAVASLWAAGVTFSRVWLGVHYASDVIAGALLGTVFAFLPWELITRVGMPQLQS